MPQKFSCSTCIDNLTTFVETIAVLDGQSALPLYHQLADELLRQIRAGEYPPGERIPSEHELARRFGLGRPTVRQATDTLMRNGVLERRRGSGTYVRSVPAQVDLFSLAGTLASFKESGVTFEAEIVGKPRTFDVEEPGHPHRGKSAVHVVRVSRVEGSPVLLEEIAFLGESFPGLARMPLKGRSLSEIVHSHYRLRLESADQSFRVTTLDARRAGLLDLRKGLPVLGVERTLNFTGKNAAVFARMFCTTDRFVFSQRIEASSHA
jgi:GntR family transcriptional regulator